MSEYTAEEYRDVLKEIYYMETELREKVFGVSKFIPGYIKDFSVSDLIEKYRAYVNAPKTGEYWKRKVNDEMVVVRRVEKDMVYVYYCDGGACDCHLLKYFVDQFARTEYESQYLEAFLSEMKEVGDTE